MLAWRSADPGLHVQEVGGPLAGKRVVSISAGAVPLRLFPCPRIYIGRFPLYVILKCTGCKAGLLDLEHDGSCAASDTDMHCAGKYRTAAVTDEGDIYMWEGWSKPAELASSRGLPMGDRVSQAMGSRTPSLGAQGRLETSSGSFSGHGPARRPARGTQSSSDDGGQLEQAALPKRNRKADRAHALSERIMPQR